MENVENEKLAKEALDKLGVSGGALKDLTGKEKLALAAAFAGTAVGSGLAGYRIGAGKMPWTKGEGGSDAPSADRIYLCRCTNTGAHAGTNLKYFVGQVEAGTPGGKTLAEVNAMFKGKKIHGQEFEDLTAEHFDSADKCFIMEIDN